MPHHGDDGGQTSSTENKKGDVATGSKLSNGADKKAFDSKKGQSSKQPKFDSLQPKFDKKSVKTSASLNFDLYNSVQNVKVALQLPNLLYSVYCTPWGGNK